MDTLICTVCGASFPRVGAKFCPACGHAVEAPARPAFTVNPARHSVRGVPGPLMVLAGAGLLVVLAATNTISLGGSKPSATAGPTVSAKASGSASITREPSHFFGTGAMTTPRMDHTATLLNSGVVLIAGGSLNDEGYGPLASAELYDPATKSFTATGSMATARSHATATLLADGRVLIAGGRDGKWKALASAELYDPSSGTFSQVGPMTEARQGHSATLLAGGNVLIAGGIDSSTGKTIATAELFNPATGSFVSTGSMSTARFGAGAALVSDDRVLVAGGMDSAGDPLASAELYDPRLGTFGPTGAMPWGLKGTIASVLADGRVVVSGSPESNFFGGPQVNSMDQAPSHSSFGVGFHVYDPVTGRFSDSPCGGTSPAEAGFSVTLLKDGRLLITGGISDRGYSQTSAASVLETDNWCLATVGNMGSARANDTATLLPDGSVLIAGGYSGSASIPFAELYRP